MADSLVIPWPFEKPDKRDRAGREHSQLESFAKQMDFQSTGI